MIDEGQWWEFGQDTGVTPILLTRSAMGLLMTTESQDLGLASHPKDGDLSQYSVPVTHRPQGEHLFQQQPSFPRRSPIQVLTRLNPA